MEENSGTYSEGENICEYSEEDIDEYPDEYSEDEIIEEFSEGERSRDSCECDDECSSGSRRNRLNMYYKRSYTEYCCDCKRFKVDNGARMIPQFPIEIRSLKELAAVASLNARDENGTRFVISSKWYLRNFMICIPTDTYITLRVCHYSSSFMLDKGILGALYFIWLEKEGKMIYRDWIKWTELRAMNELESKKDFEPYCSCLRHVPPFVKNSNVVDDAEKMGEPFLNLFNRNFYTYDDRLSGTYHFTDCQYKTIGKDFQDFQFPHFLRTLKEIYIK